jgi:hypothetical protein
MRWARAALVLALLGATLGVALDWMHVASGTTSYAHAWIFGIAWWVFPLFSSAAVALGMGPTIAERLIKRVPAPQPMWRSLVGMGLFVIAYLVSCVVHGIAGAIALGAIAAGLWWLVDRRALGVLHMIVAAMGGFVVETTLVHRGAFTHYDDTLYGVPIWLPCLYLCASLAVASLARTLIGPSTGSGRTESTSSERAVDH